MNPAAPIMASERRLVRRFRDVGATSPTSAQNLERIGARRGLALRRLLRRDVIREAEPGSFFLDEARWSDVRERRRWILLTLVIPIALIAIIAMLISTW